MVVLSQPALDPFILIQTSQPTSVFKKVTAIGLSNPDAETLIVEACQEFAFFKLINHGVPLEYMTRLEAEAIKFFKLPESEKDKAGGFLGYVNRKISPNRDMGWVEYLLLTTSPKLIHHISSSIFKENPEIFHQKVFAKLLRNEKSDCLFRLNHYRPMPCSGLQELSGQNVIGFGEHTDSQIISVLRSNNISSIEICLRDGTWVTVPPDPNSFFISVDDCLQVMTNGRLKSVRHRVSINNLNSRISMIYFGAPPLGEKIAPLPSLMERGKEILYKDFTWSDYKKSAYNSRLSDNRLGLFQNYESQ
ncbi:Gibberellin 2-beta-dioxygenase [Camellia lanceoleosa]|uniref:Gibberellin 2-beta-dioxygenase n=1 Tax=Camellia lanceoleosa TaxID=1840588 RepID=A0ACC0GIR0_9ERIC|nr:Gibberellin 2-beta-dioxygenase [Camellia lanceoleosa]